MNYKKVYYSIIKNRLKNPIKDKSVYTEEHHIKPRSFFPKGTSKKEMDQDNIVMLSFKEHYIAHLLLAKMYKKGSSKWEKMSYTIYMMCCGSQNGKREHTNSRLYEKIKKEYLDYKNEQNKLKQLKYIQDICDWVDVNNGKIPSQGSKNKHENKLSSKLSNLKSLKNNNMFLKCYEDLIVANGKEYVFYSLEDKGLIKINEICDWIDKHCLPNSNSKNKIENSYGQYITQMRINKQGGTGRRFYKSYQELVEKRGYPNLFEYINKERQGLININEICDWMDVNNGKIPSQSSNNKMEIRLSNNLSQIKTNKRRRFYKSYQELVEKRGYPNLFKFTKKSNEMYNNIKELLNWSSENNKKPSISSKNKVERKMANRMYNYNKSDTKLSEKCLNLIKENDYLSIINTNKRR